MAEDLTQTQSGAAARTTDASGPTSTGRQRRAPRVPRAPVGVTAPPAPTPAIEWRSLELIDGHLAIATNVGLSAAGPADLSAVIELLPELLLRQAREQRGDARRAQDDAARGAR